jgi:hypothetical protein
MSDISDHAVVVINHNLHIGGKQGSPSCRAIFAATLSNRHEVLRGTNKLRSRPPIGYSTRNGQISWKFFWCPEQLISVIGME